MKFSIQPLPGILDALQELNTAKFFTRDQNDARLVMGAYKHQVSDVPFSGTCTAPMLTCTISTLTTCNNNKLLLPT